MVVLLKVIPVYFNTLIFYNVTVHPNVNPYILGRYFIACDNIDPQRKMWKYDLTIEKYLVTQIASFRIGTTVLLGMDITYSNFLLCHGISGNNR